MAKVSSIVGQREEGRNCAVRKSTEINSSHSKVEGGMAARFRSVADDGDGVSRGDGAPRLDDREDPFLGHDAIASLVIDGAAIVTLLADLGDLQQDGLADSQPAADRQGHEIDPFGGEIFGKISGTDLKPHGDHFVDALLGEETELAVAAASVRVVFQSPVGKQFPLGDVSFPLAFVLAKTNGQDLSTFHCHYLGMG